MTKETLLEEMYEQEVYFRKRGIDEKDTFLKEYYFEKSRLYENFAQKVRNLELYGT